MLTEQKEQINKLAEEIFRDIYVPLYPKDKPISEMTQYEQGLHCQVRLITTSVIIAIQEKSIDLMK